MVILIHDRMATFQLQQAVFRPLLKRKALLQVFDPVSQSIVSFFSGRYHRSKRQGIGEKTGHNPDSWGPHDINAKVYRAIGWLVIMD